MRRTLRERVGIFTIFLSLIWFIFYLFHLNSKRHPIRWHGPDGCRSRFRISTTASEMIINVYSNWSEFDRKWSTGDGMFCYAVNQTLEAWIGGWMGGVANNVATGAMRYLIQHSLQSDPYGDDYDDDDDVGRFDLRALSNSKSSLGPLLWWFQLQLINRWLELSCHKMDDSFTCP